MNVLVGLDQVGYHTTSTYWYIYSTTEFMVVVSACIDVQPYNSMNRMPRLLNRHQNGVHLIRHTPCKLTISQCYTAGILWYYGATTPYFDKPFLYSTLPPVGNESFAIPWPSLRICTVLNQSHFFVWSLAAAACRSPCIKSNVIVANEYDLALGWSQCEEKSTHHYQVLPE